MSGGRGRGRGILATKIQSLIHKPGEVHQENNNYDFTLMQIQQLNADSVESHYTEIIEKSKNCITSKILLQNVGTAMHERAMKDRHGAKVIAQLCKKMIALECDDLNFRTILLNLLQEDFKNKESIRTVSREQFANSVAFLCEIFGCVHLANGEPYKVLIGPISQGMKMLLDSSATLFEVRTCTEQLCSIGPVMMKHCPDVVEEIYLALRSKILDPSTAQNKRMFGCLLEALELYCCKWEPFPEKVVQFYETNCNPSTNEKTPIDRPISPLEPPENLRLFIDHKVNPSFNYNSQNGGSNRIVKKDLVKSHNNKDELWD